MTIVAWKYNEKALNLPLMLGGMDQLEDSGEFDIFVSHDSSLPITDCGFFISPFTGDYKGTHTPLKDYERVLWLADNYPGYGLKVNQTYNTTGVFDDGSMLRYFDLDREERTDIFAGETIEIATGIETGNQSVVNSYDPEKKLFFLTNGFPNNVKGEGYKIDIEKDQFFKFQQGASYNYPISLLNKGGAIDKGESVLIKLQMKVPKFALSGGSFYFDLNMRFTSLEE